MKNLHIIKHPLIQDSLTHLRDKTTGLEQFRQYSNKLTQLLIAESITDLQLKLGETETPLTTTTGELLDEDITVIPVLRAGIAMLDAVMELIPKVKVGFVGMQRDEETAEASQYYWKLPTLTEESTVLITDPMLATGGSVEQLLKQIDQTPVKSIRIICVIAAPEGVEKITSSFPKVQIYTASLDEKLNDKKYIVPGLGDYGDRYFGT